MSKKGKVDGRTAVKTEWDDFFLYIKSKNRFLLNARWQSYIDFIIATARHRRICIRKGKVLSRARIGEYHFKKTLYPHRAAHFYSHPLPPRELKAAPASVLSEGRFNPRGLSYLYLADSDKTALLECQPWIAAPVTVAKYKIGRNMNVLDMTKELKMPPAPRGGWRSDEERIWFSLGTAFSEPIFPEAKAIDYIPTQYIAEVFKNAGWDGIKYKSAVHIDGYNVVLFKKKDALIVKCGLYRIESINLNAPFIGRWQTNGGVQQRPKRILLKKKGSAE